MGEDGPDPKRFVLVNDLFYSGERMVSILAFLRKHIFYTQYAKGFAGEPMMYVGWVAYVIFQGVHTSIPKETYSFVIFQGSGLPPPLWIRACRHFNTSLEASKRSMIEIMVFFFAVFFLTSVTDLQ